MAMNWLTRLIGAAAFATTALGGAISAQAASYTFSLTANPADGAFGTFTIGQSVFNTYELLLPIGDPITFNSGDDVTLNLALSSALTVPFGNQFLGVNLKTDVDPTNASTTGQITFSGLSGAPIGNPQNASCGNCLSNIIFTTGAAYSFLGLLSEATYTFDGPVTLNGLSLSYQVETPLPAALPLFATGLFGIGFLNWMRRRRAA